MRFFIEESRVRAKSAPKGRVLWPQNNLKAKVFNYDKLPLYLDRFLRYLWFTWAFSFSVNFDFFHLFQHTFDSFCWNNLFVPVVFKGLKDIHFITVFVA